MTNEENDGDRTEAFLEMKDGEIADGVVVADLDDDEEGKDSRTAPMCKLAALSSSISSYHLR